MITEKMNKSCSACGAKNSMAWDSKPIELNDKIGRVKDLTFDFCEECGHVENIELS